MRNFGTLFSAFQFFFNMYLFIYLLISDKGLRTWVSDSTQKIIHCK